MELAKPYGANEHAQHARPIDGADGWFEYLGKHCGRSPSHYQRQRAAVPAAWAKCPRVWGKRGKAWPTLEPHKLLVDIRTFHQFRRLVKRARIAEARRALPLNRKRVGKLRRLLKCPERPRSTCRAVGEWMTVNEQTAILAALYIARPPDPPAGDGEA